MRDTPPEINYTFLNGLEKVMAFALKQNKLILFLFTPVRRTLTGNFFLAAAVCCSLDILI